jgi:hypothetical protein
LPYPDIQVIYNYYGKAQLKLGLAIVHMWDCPGIFSSKLFFMSQVSLIRRSNQLSTGAEAADNGGGNELYTVKKVSDFPVPIGDVTDQTLPGRGIIHAKGEFG